MLMYTALAFILDANSLLDNLDANSGFTFSCEFYLKVSVFILNVNSLLDNLDANCGFTFFCEFDEMQSVGKRIGVEEPFLMRMAHGGPMRFNKSRENTKGLNGKFSHRSGIKKSQMLSDEETIRVCKRFYVALILSRLVQVSFIYCKFTCPFIPFSWDML